MNDDERHKELLLAIQKLTIAVGSLNPDPEKTIGQHRSSKRKAQFLSWYASIVSTFAMFILGANFLINLLNEA